VIKASDVQVGSTQQYNIQTENCPHIAGKKINSNIQHSTVEIPRDIINAQQ